MQIRTFVATSVALACLTVTAAAQTIGIATTQVGGFQYTTTAALGKVLNEKTDIRARVQSFGSGNQFLPLINSGEMDIALVSGTEATFAFTGTYWYAGQKMPNLRAIAALVPNMTGYFVRADSPMRTVADLKGKRVSTGFDAQPTAALLSKSVLATAGMTENDLVKVPAPHVKNSAADFVRGNVDAYYYAVLAGKNAEVSAEVGGIRLLAIDDSPEALERASKIAPLSSAVTLTPDSKIAGVLKPTPTLSATYLLVAGAHVPDKVITQILTVLTNDQTDLIAASANFKQYQPKNMHRKTTLPYHPAAIAFYKSHGMGTPK